jgi:hypothetical protein
VFRTDGRILLFFLHFVEFDTCCFRFILIPFEASNVFQSMPCFAVFNPPFNPFLLPFVVS